MHNHKRQETIPSDVGVSATLSNIIEPEKVNCWMQDDFFKLDHIDRKVLFWMIDNKPHAIRHWLTDVALVYRRKDVMIDVNKLFAEIELELQLEDRPNQ